VPLGKHQRRRGHGLLELVVAPSGDWALAAGHGLAKRVENAHGVEPGRPRDVLPQVPLIIAINQYKPLHSVVRLSKKCNNSEHAGYAYGWLDCNLASTAGMHTGLTRAIHQAQHRKAFGAYLIDHPLMRNVLADLAVEAEAATIVAMRMAGATDGVVRGDEREALLRRIGLAASKYWVCKRALPQAAEALECLGGNGYVEDSGMPRLYREAPLMGIWEGSGNVSALDTLRAMATRPACVEVLFDELATTAGHDARLDAHVATLQAALADMQTIQYRARKIAEDISLALQGSLLVRHGHPAVAEAFLATRMGGQWGGAFGTLPTGLDLAPILERAMVKG
jgi:putative acyl-CoA dehydrogenase